MSPPKAPDGTEKKTDWIGWIRLGIAIFVLVGSWFYAFEKTRHACETNAMNIEKNQQWIDRHSVDYREVQRDMQNIQIMQAEIKIDTNYIQETLKEIKEDVKDIKSRDP